MPSMCVSVYCKRERERERERVLKRYAGIFYIIHVCWSPVPLATVIRLSYYRNDISVCYFFIFERQMPRLCAYVVLMICVCVLSVYV